MSGIFSPHIVVTVEYVFISCFTLNHVSFLLHREGTVWGTCDSDIDGLKLKNLDFVGPREEGRVTRFMLSLLFRSFALFI